MFKKEKLDQAEVGLPPLDFPLDQFDLALYFKDANTPIKTIVDVTNTPTKASPIRFGNYEYGGVDYVFRDYGLTQAEFVANGEYLTDIKFTYSTQHDNVTSHGFFTTWFDSVQTIDVGLYTDNTLTEIASIHNDDLHQYIGKWIYLTFMVDGGG